MDDFEHIVAPLFSFAFAALARKPYARQELFEALKKKFSGVEDPLLVKVLDELERLHYIDDKKFAEEFVRYKRAIAPRGDILLEKELRARKIPPSLIEEVLSERTPEEILEDALSVGRKKMEGLVRLPDKEKQKEKLFRFLLGRGFSLSVCHEVFGVLSGEEDGE